MMETVVLKAHVGSDGILNISIPVEFKDTNLEVTLVYAEGEGKKISPEQQREIVNNLVGNLSGIKEEEDDDEFFMIEESGKF